MRDLEAVLYLVGGYYLLKVASDYGIFQVNEEDQTGNFLDEMPDAEDLANMATGEEMDYQTKQQNTRAFLGAIRYAEGTTGTEGYQALFGWRQGNGRIFNGFADHPRQYFNYTDLSGKTIRTSAAGAYQITATTYDLLRKKYPSFSGFSPATQDQLALALIRDVGALADVENGRLETAVRKCRKIWASLPNSDVNQPTRSIQQITAAYTKNGGALA